MPNRNYIFTRPLLGSLANLGLGHVVISPGSRNTPLAIAAAETPNLETSVHLDERSAAFFALGMAKISESPVALICTSGTAAAEYLPALVEASLSQVPLIVLTADRPQELRDTGAPQTIPQAALYGRAVKWSHDAAPPDPSADPARYATRLATQAWTVSQESPAGPVHLNLAFRDPLAPQQTDEVAVAAPPTPIVHLGIPTATDGALLAVARQMRDKKVLIVAGPSGQAATAPAVAELAEALAAPIFADPLSGLRAGSHPFDRVISAGDVLARQGVLESALRPDIVLRFGSVPTSKALWSWLAATPTEQIWVDAGTWREATSSATTIVRADVADTARRLAELVTPGPDDWTAAWVQAEDTLAAQWLEQWRDVPWPSEPAVVAEIADGVVDGCALVISSSMPIRDVDAFFGTQDRPLRFVSNRAANGIDGVISTALGVAATGRPTYLLIGDVAFLHDVGALAMAVRLRLDITIVVVDNDGGGIFHFLPQADHPEFFEPMLATPHGADVVSIAVGFGADVTQPDSVEEFRSLLGAPTGIRVVVVKTDRHENRQFHDQLFEA